MHEEACDVVETSTVGKPLVLPCSTTPYYYILAVSVTGEHIMPHFNNSNTVLTSYLHQQVHDSVYSDNPMRSAGLCSQSS